MPVAHKYLPHYTYDDYSLWEGRWEIIDGIPYAMSPAPVPGHQRTNGRLFSRFDESLTRTCKHCKTYMPIDWKITEDTVVQPDLLIVCTPIEKKFLDFAPALVAEIISPSSAFNDRNIKKELYAAQQVRYYLIIDPQFKRTEIYEFINDTYNLLPASGDNFTFAFDEDCSASVNLAGIWE